MKRLQPPIHLLRAFTTTARFGSVSRACEALHLSQSAVSKQISELEQLTGVLLFERIRQRLTLTPAGVRYEAAVRPVLAQLEAATLELITSGDGGGALHLSTLPTFGAKWLIPRLPDFQRQHPQIELHYVPYAQGYDFQREDLDCAILFGNGRWPGARADYLTGREVVLIAPPGLPPAFSYKTGCAAAPAVPAAARCRRGQTASTGTCAKKRCPPPDASADSANRRAVQHQLAAVRHFKTPRCAGAAVVPAFEPACRRMGGRVAQQQVHGVGGFAPDA